MVNILLLSDDVGNFAGLETGLKRYENTNCFRAETSQLALELISEKAIDLVIVDDTFADASGIDFVKQLVSENPMTNCALVSSLSEKAFHEATEGLGILMQLPRQPGEKQAQLLMDTLYKIIKMY